MGHSSPSLKVNHHCASTRKHQDKVPIPSEIASRLHSETESHRAIRETDFKTDFIKLELRLFQQLPIVRFS